MNFNFNNELSLYKFTQANKDFLEGGVLFNQTALTACGKIHAELSDEQFKGANPKFFCGFAWTYYMDWRMTRAKSCAHLLDMYKTLNVGFSAQHFVGETFFAGIPVVTAEEIDLAIELYQVDEAGSPISKGDDGFCYQKIGNDGLLHETDEFGEFLSYDGFVDLTDPVEPELACLSCAHLGGNGSPCTDLDEFSCHKFGKS